MIPDFRTYVGESVWADIHRRSNGKQERKEDDVDLLDLNDFCEYVNKIYGLFDHSFDIRIHTYKDDVWMQVPLFNDDSGYICEAAYDGGQIWTTYDMISQFVNINEIRTKF